MYPKLNGFNTKAVTLYTDDDIKIGDPVKLLEDACAAPAAATEKFCGICTDKRGNYITVTLVGYAQTKYSGTAPTVGYNSLAADGKNGVAVNDKGRELLVLDVDKDNNIVAIML